MARQAILVAARRSPVAPRGGALKTLEVDALAAPVLTACLDDAGLDGAMVDEVIVGNALYGGGNPARRLALLAGVPESVPALTLDRQCCSGLDAILMAARLIESGAANCVLAGGVESFSRAPLRLSRPRGPDEVPRLYDRPPFTPWPERDPEMADAAAALAAHAGIGLEDQLAYAVASHAKACAAREAGRLTAELVESVGLSRDAFARALSLATGRRSRVIAGEGESRILTATTAVEADGAAFVCVVSDRLAAARSVTDGCRLIGGASAGADPEMPGLAPVAAGQKVFAATGLRAHRMAAAEVMEAYAVQAMACARALDLPAASLNRGGGALARGHPIGASGAILAVRLFHELRGEPSGALGLAAIASAGGLGTAAILQRLAG